MEDTIYESHKKVKRLAMTRLAYNAYRGWELPSDENGDDEGYLVEYLDGDVANDVRHEGYISWSPKAQFDNGYTAIEDSFLERLKKESSELDEKCTKLDAFFITDTFQGLDPVNSKLLADQMLHMESYLSVLKKRLDLLS